MAKLILVLGNQLFPPTLLKTHIGDESPTYVFMREDVELCTYFRFHKQKIVFFLSAMREYKKELEKEGIRVTYQTLDRTAEKSYEANLLEEVAKNKITKVSFFEIEDKFFEKIILSVLSAAGIEVEVWQSPMFLTARAEFKSYLDKANKPMMKFFYEGQRKKLKLLIDEKYNPIGGKWSFDSENRLPLSKKIIPPDLKTAPPLATVSEVQGLVDEQFSQHPGNAQEFWLPVRRADALSWLETFLNERLREFGPFEDALPSHSDFVFHSVLTPFLNTGLLTPDLIISRTLEVAADENLPIASVEGFVRQVIGWREFVRGIYQNYSEKQDSLNFFNHDKKLSSHWYDGTTGIAPLDQTIKKALRLGYTHHIERLMVLGSLMLLLEIHPQEAHRWFMEMYIDSSDWVMGPNVYGMALFSDGGIFATKPYFCGSNYYRKMGSYRADESWCDGVDGLYWGFVEKNKTFFLKNPRTSMMVKTVEKMSLEKKNRIYAAAQIIKEKITR